MTGATALRHVAPWMRAPRPTVLACGLTRTQRTHLDAGLRLTYALRYIDTFDDLEAALPALTGCDVIVLGPEDVRGRDAVGLVERISRDWAETAVVVFFPAAADQMPTAMSMVRAGAHELVHEGVHPTATKLAVAVENARRYKAGNAVYDRLEPMIPPGVRSMTQAILGRPEQVTTVTRLARAEGVHRKTLFNRCARAHFLQPAELIVWCRLAMVARLLDRSGATVEAIAVTLGFASHTALRNAIKRYLGCTATAARERGALDLLIGAFSRRITAVSLHIR